MRYSWVRKQSGEILFPLLSLKKNREPKNVSVSHTHFTLKKKRVSSQKTHLVNSLPKKTTFPSTQKTHMGFWEVTLLPNLTITPDHYAT